jgi:hypothetical protein
MIYKILMETRDAQLNGNLEPPLSQGIKLGVMICNLQFISDWGISISFKLQ